MEDSSQENSFDVIIIGAGISGINMGYRLQEKNPELSYAILEGRHEIGGTWSLFQYPGIRSDSDLYTFGFPWRSWTAQTSIAQGNLIVEYVKESAQVAGIDKNIRFNHHVNAASWSSDDKAWKFDVTADKTTKKQFRSRFLMLCTGYYDYEQPLTTVIPGIEDFKGTVVHPQFWPKDLDYSDKDVVIVGSGATAVTLLPALAQKARHVTMLQRSPSYVLSQPVKQDKLDFVIRKLFPTMFAERLVRFKWILVSFLVIRICHAFPNFARKLFTKATKAQLPPSISMDPHFKPSYYPWEQRMCICPDGDFYKSLRDGNGSVETGVISTVTANSIKLQSGAELNPDIIVTATGLKLQIAGGINVSVDGQPYHVPQKYIWKGAMMEDLPNAAFFIGYVDASWTLGADATAQLLCRILKQMDKEGVVQIVPRRNEEEKSLMKDVPVLNLSSTYVRKAADALPKAGDRGQWRPRSYYFQDIWTAWFGDIKTGMEWIRGV